jgi:hypothetical protein
MSRLSRPSKDVGGVDVLFPQKHQKKTFLKQNNQPSTRADPP